MESNDTIFIIPSYANSKEMFEAITVNCIRSIRKFYPEVNILIVNDSPQEIISDEMIKDYFADPNLDVTYPPMQGSACSYALNIFHQMDTYKYAIVLHDSVQLIAPLEKIDYDIKYLWYFTVHHLWQYANIPYKHSTIKTHEDEILGMYVNLDSSNFKNKFIELYYQKSNWCGCFGNMVIISKQFLQELEEKTKILSLSKFVRTRRDRMVMETIFAVAVYYVKPFNLIDEKSYSMEGKWDNVEYTIYKKNGGRGAVGKYLIKYTFER